MTTSTRLTVAEMKAHVESLIAAHFDLKVRWTDRPGRARAIREFEEIILAPVRSELSYATALHEFGHFYGRFQNSQRVMARERGAWIWAMRNALKWTPRMELDMVRSLAWYQARRRKIDAKWSPPTSVVVSVTSAAVEARGDQEAGQAGLETR